MSFAEIRANIVRKLEDQDFELLKVFASSLKHHESVTREELQNYSKIPLGNLNYRLTRLYEMNLIERSKRGFAMSTNGLDTIALRMLADKDIIYGIRKPIGIGKESDVYEAIAISNEEYAIKFFRIGRTSFKQVRKKRTVSRKTFIHNWLLVNIEAAQKEYDILRELSNTSIGIPKPYYSIMHCVIMNRINGIRLANTKELKDPKKTLQDILQNIAIAYTHGVINCDLSEYNILIDDNDGTWIIDWPQAVRRDHPNSDDLLKRDIFNIVKFFNRRYDLGQDKGKALEDVITAKKVI